MEKKVGIIFLVGVLISILIFILFKNENVDYLAIGDSLSYGSSPINIKTTSFSDLLNESYPDKINSYNSDYSFQNLTSRDLFDFIITNNEIKENSLSIKQLISSAEIITIALGKDELNNNQNINLYLYYMDKALELITDISHQNIYLIGLYSDSNKINDINYQLSLIAKKYNITFVNIDEVVKEEYKYENSDYLNIKGHEKIVENLLKTIDS